MNKNEKVNKNNKIDRTQLKTSSSSVDKKILSLLPSKNKKKAAIDYSGGSIDSNIFKNKIDDYTIIKEIGIGAYAVVKQAIHKPTNKEYAIKIYEKIKLLDIQKKNSVKREIAILASIDHPSLIKIYEVIDLAKQVRN